MGEALTNAADFFLFFTPHFNDIDIKLIFLYENRTPQTEKNA